MMKSKIYNVTDGFNAHLLYNNASLDYLIG